MTEINSKIHPIKMEQCSIPIEIEEEQKEADNALEWHPQHLHEVVAVAMVVKNWLRPQRERAKEQQRNAEILAATNEVNTSLVFEPMAITMERIRVLKQLGRSPSQNSLLASAGMRPGSKISSASLLSNGGAKKASSADISHKSSTIGAALMPMPTALNEADKEEITATGTRIVEGRNGNAIGAKINEMTEAETTVGQERELVGQEDGSRGRKLRESMAIWLRTTSREIIALPHISIDPIGNFYAYWTFCVYLVFLYNAFMCVLFVFDDTQGNAFFALWLTINALCDSVNLFDLFINSRLTYMEDGMLMKDWRRLTKRYLRRWHFPMDLLAIFPLDLILLLNRNISLSRVNRLAKCYRVWEFVQMTNVRTNYPNAFRILHIIIVCVYNNFIVSGPFFWPLNKEATNLGRLYAIQIKSQMLCQFHNRVNVLFHWNAALYFKISLFYGIFTTDPAAWEFNLVKNQDPIWVDCGQVLWAEIGEGECGFNESGRGDPDTERANYLEEMVKYWTNRSELLHFSNFSKQYSLSFYWSSLTLTTSGQQPYPTAAMHNFLEIFDTIVGVLVFAVIVGSVGNVVTTMNRGRAEIQQLNDGIKFYMNYRNVSDGMQKRVLDCIHYIQRHAQIQNEETIMGTIPPRLRGELAVHLHMETLRGIELFADCEPSLLYELVLRLQMQMFAPNDFICRRGDLAKEMYVLKRGVLAVINDDDDSEEQHQKRLGKGNAFGEMAILRPTGPLGRLLSRRPHSLRSLGYSEVYLLTQEDALAVFVDYPEQRHSLIQKATEILIARGQLKPEDLVQQGPLSPVEFCGIESTIEVLQKLEGTLEEIDVQLDQLYAKFTNNSSEMKREMTSLEVNYRQIRQKMKAKVEEE